MQGAQLREALSIARALDLATHWYGAEYLVTDSAEVQLRRLLSVALAAKLGSFKLSQFLEEVPGDNALAELPDDVLRSLSERLKLEMKLEQLTAAKQETGAAADHKNREKPKRNSRWLSVRGLRNHQQALQQAV